MNIDYDAKDKRMLIRCPLWANDLVRTVPSVRWSKAQRAWCAPLIRANATALRALSVMDGVTLTQVAATALTAYESSMEHRASGKGRKVGFPSWYKFKTEPTPYQMEALNKGYGLTAMGLFLPMQTGKTKTVIDMTAAHRMEGHIHGQLILSKYTLRRNIAEQFEIHCPIPYSICMPQTDKPRQFDKWLGSKHDYKIVIAGWESLSQGGLFEMLRTFGRAMAGKMATTGDEVTYITNHQAERSKRATALARLGKYVYGLSGTPTLEGPMNLFMEFEFIDPDIIGIGDFYAFRNRYAVMGGYHREVRPGKKVPTEIIGYTNLDELTKLIAPNVYEIDKEEAMPGLPPKRYQRRTVELSKAQRVVYDQIKRDGAFTLDGDPEMVLKNVLEVMLRLHQVAGGYAVRPREERRLGRDGEPRIVMKYDAVELVKPKDNPKIQEVVAVVEETGNKKQGIIWAVYQPEIQAIVGELKRMGKRIGELHGGVPEPARQPMINAYQNGDYDWIVGNASTGGMGYTMMASRVNVFYNNTRKLIDRVQAEDRSWGRGQTQSGVWIDILAERTVDEVALDAILDKKDLDDYMRARIRDAVRLLDGRIT